MRLALYGNITAGNPGLYGIVPFISNILFYSICLCHLKKNIIYSLICNYFWLPIFSDTGYKMTM